MSIAKKAGKRCQLLREGFNLSLIMDYPNCNRNTSIQICHSGNNRKHSNQSAAFRQTKRLRRGDEDAMDGDYD